MDDDGLRWIYHSNPNFSLRNQDGIHGFSLDKKQATEGEIYLAHVLRAQFAVEGKALLEELEAAGHIAAIVKSRDACWGSACFLLLIQPGTPVCGMLSLTSKMGLPSLEMHSQTCPEVCLLDDSKLS